MKFIFPQNYSFKNKLFGFIDYSTAILNILWDAFIFCCLDFFPFSITIKISCFIILCFPLFLLSIFGLNHENILYVSIYMFKFIKNRRIYLYSKLSDNNQSNYSRVI